MTQPSVSPRVAQISEWETLSHRLRRPEFVLECELACESVAKSANHRGAPGRTVTVESPLFCREPNGPGAQLRGPPVEVGLE